MAAAALAWAGRLRRIVRRAPGQPSGRSSGRRAPRGRGLPRRKVVLRAAVGVPVVLAALGAGGWWTSTTSVFSAHRIQVTGASHLSRAEVLRAAGVNGATNVMWTPTSTIASSLEASPWVASATVTRDLPSTLRIRITERTPASAVLVGSTWFLVAGDGTVLGPARGRSHLPALPNADRLTVGERAGALAVPAAVAGSMEPWLRKRVTAVIPADDGTVQLALADGARVLFGPASDLQAKDQALVGILRWAAQRGTHLGTIDVRSPVAPAAVPIA
jgi:cell division protein FtsQ